MTDLKPCPFCGGEVSWRGGAIYCAKCDYDFRRGPFDYTEARWNTRTERTCKMAHSEEYSGDELYPTDVWTCECGGVTFDGKPKYCPECGAKVVD